MSKIIKCPDWGNAGRLLKEMGIDWDEVVQPRIEVSNLYSYYSHQRRTEPGIMVYFMKDNCDVAYFTIGLDLLFIHDTPRGPWSSRILAEAENYFH